MIFKKIFILGLFLLILFVPQANAEKYRFTDLNYHHPYYESIKYLLELGSLTNKTIIKGYIENNTPNEWGELWGEFKPNNPINRAEFTKIMVIVKTLEGDITFSPENCFSDVPSDAWFSPYVCYAKKEGMISGYPDQTFKPEKNISFAEASKIIAQMFQLKTSPEEIWYKPFVDALGSEKAIPMSILAFDQLVTRGEMVEMIARLRTGDKEKASKDYGSLSLLNALKKYQAYEKWKLPEKIIESNSLYFTEAVNNDCIGLEFGNVANGDLLSTLIADQMARLRMKLDVYTPDYMIDLENKIVAHTKKTYNASFFAFDVCHLKENIDIAAGYLWPWGKIRSEEDRVDENEAILMIINTNTVFSYKNIKLINNTATGAEQMPCSAELQPGENKILWNCFLGIARDGDDYIIGSDSKTWEFPLDGGKPEVFEDILSVEPNHYRNTSYGFQFEYPKSWPEPKFDPETESWDLSPVSKEYCEGVDCVLVTLSISDPKYRENVRKKIKNDPLNKISSDYMDRMIYESDGICTDTTGIIFTTSYTFTLNSHCSEFRNEFSMIISSFETIKE